MPPKTPAAPQVPGEPTNPEAENQAAEATTTETVEAETVAVPKDQLEALLARVAALENQQPTVRRANPEADLPDAETIDPKLIKSPVLSKQGWVVPESYGSNPAAKNL